MVVCATSKGFSFAAASLRWLALLCGGGGAPCKAGVVVLLVRPLELTPVLLRIGCAACFVFASPARAFSFVAIVLRPFLSFFFFRAKKIFTDDVSLSRVCVGSPSSVPIPLWWCCLVRHESGNMMLGETRGYQSAADFKPKHRQDLVDVGHDEH
jgi:hypothetical protein